jgi:hypothetical protein
MRRRIRTMTALLTIASLGLLGACAGDDDGDESAGAGEDPRPVGRAVDEQGSFDSSGGASGGTFGAAALPSVGPAVIKTADLRVRVGSRALDDSIEEATSIAGRFSGFVLSTSVDDDSAGRANIVIRVPADRFESALAEMSELGTVTEETVSGKDVSAEFVDLEARLRNFSAQEAVLLRLMDRAQSIVDTIRVQRELQQVQLEVERIRGRLRFLQDQTELSTISVSFVEAGAPAPATGTLGKAWNRAADGFLAVISGAIVALGFITPMALLGGLVYLAVWMAMRRVAASGKSG